jgi:hypothetical protein
LALKTTPNKPKPPILPTIQINKTAFYPAPQKTLGILQKIKGFRGISMSPFIYLLEERIKFHCGRNGDM